MAFDKKSLDGYVEVKDRILAFRKDHPEGVFQSEVVFHKEWDGEFQAPVYNNDGKRTGKAWKKGRCGLICVKGMVFRSATDSLPAIGHSWMQTPGTTPYTEGSEIENAETSAWGRALATMGYGITKSLASIDEIRNKSDDDFFADASDKSQGAGITVEGQDFLTGEKKSATGKTVSEAIEKLDGGAVDTWREVQPTDKPLITREQCEEAARLIDLLEKQQPDEYAKLAKAPNGIEIISWTKEQAQKRIAKMRSLVKVEQPDDDIPF